MGLFLGVLRRVGFGGGLDPPRSAWFNDRFLVGFDAPSSTLLLEGYCGAFGLGRPDRDFDFADRERLAVIALGVGAEEAGVQVFLGIEECRVSDFESARAVSGLVVDLKRIAAAQAAQGEAQVVTDGHQPDLVDVGVIAFDIIDQEQPVGIGVGPADQAAADIRLAARAGVEPELANDLEAGDIRDRVR